MGFFTIIIIIAFGLAMDAFAVSVASGLEMTRLRISHAMRMALSFGFFQALMPIIGWAAGNQARLFISGMDHWIAFGLLTAIGIKMIYEAFKIKEKADEPEEMSIYILLILSLATSIDALAAGVSLSFLNVAIIVPSIIIGAVTFLLSLAGVLIGRRFGHFFETKIEIAGGLILIGIGIKILIEHIS
jgi:putative Mn2+ efflux pump MntP